jgi:hypothetical protein
VIFRIEHRKRLLILLPLLLLAAAAALLLHQYFSQTLLRIRVAATGEVLFETPAGPGDRIDVAWTHSLDKVPWHESYHVAPDGTIVLDSFSITAFAAGIPQDKGTPRLAADGLIWFENIGQVFEEFHWLNSQYTGNIGLNGAVIANGAELPNHVQLILRIERRAAYARAS